MPESMASDIVPLDFQEVPFRSFKLKSLSVADKISLKEELMAELVLVRSATEKFPSIIPKTEGLCKRASKNSLSSEQDEVFITRKRKSSERSQSGVVLSTVISETGSTSTHPQITIAPEMFNCQNDKDWEMNGSRSRLCNTILLKLMTDRYSWVFNRPVDPVKENIPDYFSIISKPMDLGTIKEKLESRRYTSTRQFAADVKLTFDNASTYNPSGTRVHHMAKLLGTKFSLEWENAESKWRREGPNAAVEPKAKKMKMEPIESKLVVHKKASLNSISRSNASLSAAEKLKLKKDLEKFPSKSMPPRLINFLRKNSMLGPMNNDGVCIKVDKIEDRTLRKLQQIMKIVIDGRLPNLVDGTKKGGNCTKQDSTNGVGHTKAKSQSIARDETNRAYRVREGGKKLEQECKEEKSEIDELQAEPTTESAEQKANSEFNLNIKKEREEFKLALEKIEATAEIDNFFHVVKELNGLGCENLSFYGLQQLGLVLKNDDFDDEDDDQMLIVGDDDMEEGEIRV